MARCRCANAPSSTPQALWYLVASAIANTACPIPHPFVAPMHRPCLLRVPAARADRAARGRSDSAGPGGPRGEIDAPEDDQAAHPRPARAQQVVPGARRCRQRVHAARAAREARGRHDSAGPGGPRGEQQAPEDDRATRSAWAPSARTRRRCSATPGRARLDRPRWGGWARAETRQVWRRPDDLGRPRGYRAPGGRGATGARDLLRRAARGCMGRALGPVWPSWCARGGPARLPAAAAARPGFRALNRFLCGT